MRYLDHLSQWLDADGRLNDFLRLRDGRVIFAEELDVLALAGAHGVPLEISFCPQITRRVLAMEAHFAAARMQTGYRGDFIYAYATKANFAEEVVRTAVAAGAHYETSSAFDVRIAHQLWRRGTLPRGRLICCNGSKEPAYLDAIIALRTAGCDTIVPILDDLAELDALLACPAPLLIGVRERKDVGDLAEGIAHGYDRFGLLPEEMERAADRIAGTPHRLILYHAMVGSQLENAAHFQAEILESLEGYGRLRARAPELSLFNFGGGMPTSAYSLGFGFDYAGFATSLLRAALAWASANGHPHPHLVGEFGRYTCADHAAHVFCVGRTKPGHPGERPWYLVDGSLMVALPDILIVEGQQFIALPLNHMDKPAVPVVLGGRRTCDSDDFYPRAADPPLILPEVGPGDEPLLIAFFGTGAYQAMLSGEGGAHHCLAPEAPKLIVERQSGALTTRVIPEQSWESVLSDLGYR